MTPIISYISPTQTSAGTNGLTLTVFGQNFDVNTNVNFGGTVLTTTFVGINQVTALVPASLLSSGSIGSATVSVQNNSGSSNTAQFSITPLSSTSINDLSNIASGVNLSAITNNTQTISPYIKIISNVQSYIVQQNDSLQSIALSILGDASRWMDIAFINNLRYPYISSSPIDTAGNNSITTTLVNTANIGDNSLILNNLSQFINVGVVLFFTLVNKLTNGTINTTSELHTVISVDTNPYNYDVTVALDSPMENNYLAGTTINVLTTSNNTTSVVTSPGSPILVPSNTPNSSVVKLSQSNNKNSDIYLGQDLSLDSNGNINGSNTGDLATITGIPNLTQALSNRLRTELGELSYYPQYGDPLLDYIGYVNSNALAILANKELSKTLLQDPRVNGINQIQTDIYNDQLNVSVSIQITNMSSGVTFNFALNN